MKKILVPFDFSEIANYALDLAAQLAKKNDGSTVSLIHVIEHPTPETVKTMGVSDVDPMEDLYIKKLTDKLTANLQTVVSDSNYSGVDLSYKIVVGHPFKEISEEINTKGIELVIMGTRGSSGLEEMLVGSNAEKMVRHAKCPVITISEKARVSEIKKIAFATNFQNVPAAFVHHLKALQSALDAELKIVKINTPASFSTSRDDKKQMEDFIARFNIQNCTFDIYNYYNEEEGILAYASDVEAGLIALGTNQRKGIGHFFAGSIAEDVVNHAKRPVWTYSLESDL